MILAINNIILIRPFRYYVVNPPITLLSGLGGQKTAVKGVIYLNQETIFGT